MGRRDRQLRYRQRRDQRRRAKKSRKKDFDLKDLFYHNEFFEREDFDWDDWGDFRRRVIIDSSKKPDTGFPIGLGIAALFVALLFGLGPLLPLVGILILVAGLATLAGRVFFGFRKLATRTFRRLFESKQEKQRRMLADLDRRLRDDGEPRTEHLLRKLSHLYQTLESDIQDGTLTIAAKDVLESVDQVNKVCIEHLEESHQLWEEAQADPYVAEVKLKQREALIQEVNKSVTHLEGIVGQLHEQSMKRNRRQLKRLRDELDQNLEVAKRVEERTEELVEPSGTYEME